MLTDLAIRTWHIYLVYLLPFAVFFEGSILPDCPIISSDACGL